MNRFVLAEEGHVVNLINPIDINGAGADSDVFSMEGYSHASIVVQLGVTGAASTLTVYECDDFTPTNSTAIAFRYYAEATAGGDTLAAEAAATTSGISTGTADGIMYVIEIDAADLSDGYPCLQIKLSDPSAATVVSAVAILSGGRFKSPASATVIA